VGETRVDLQHLLEDLKDAYTGSIEETILTEVSRTRSIRARPASGSSPVPPKPP
jgi:hypothetical protein